MAEAEAGEAAAPGEAADLDRPLDYFAALLVRARSEEVLGWGADDFANALRWCAYWEARVAGTGGGPQPRRAELEAALARLRQRRPAPAVRLGVDDLGQVCRRPL